MARPLPTKPLPRIGTAGSSIPRDAADAFPGPGSHLERYAQVLNCAEINSSFYRPPRPATWLRWAVSVPANFRFSVKAPRTITHEGALAPAPSLLQDFLAGATLLAEKLGPLLFQLPPKLAFDPTKAETFFDHLRQLHPGPVALEPRHPSWFTPEVTDLLTSHDIARVAADPARVPEAAHPASSPTLRYYRLHGSPRIYYSPYPEDYLTTLAADITNQPQAETWVIFDNTASGAAIHNALSLTQLTHPVA
jgi:uncharacterized protein YecE (DUF72 family)